MNLDMAMDAEPHLYRDFRSPSIPKQRRRKTLNRYYSYRAVHPSWVGQSYYTLQLVSSEVHTAHIVPHRLRHKVPNPPVTHVTEKEEPALLEVLRRDHGWSSFGPLWVTPEIHVAIAQAKAADSNAYPIVIPESETTEPNNPTIPHDIERIPIQPPHEFSPTLPTNLHLKLRLKTWTKRDNYQNAAYFWWGPDRRHSRGKRSYRERHLQKWNEKELGRGARNRASQLRWEVDGSCGILGDKWQCSSNVVYDDCTLDFDAYWDWVPDEWDETDWWDDDGYGIVDDEGWDGYHSFTERVGRLEVVHMICGSRRLWCGHKKVAELDGVDEDEEDAFSVGSDVVILDLVDVDVDIDLDADLVRMSDLAEVLVEGEWDVVSEASSVWGT